jgi:hypothetical protein
MENSDKNKFASVMYGLAGNFGGKLSKDDLKLRFTALIEYSIKDISLAGTWLLKNRVATYPPVPTTKEIIDAISKTKGKLENKEVAEIEADKILRLLKQWGRECGTRFKDPVTDYLMVYRWNFQYLGGLSEKDLKWWRKDFIEAYKDTELQKDNFLDVADKAGMIPAKNLTRLLDK